MENYSDFDDEGSGLELVHVSDVLDYLGEYTFPRHRYPMVLSATFIRSIFA
jgi:hypothetical protein